MFFSDVSRFFKSIEQLSSRTEITKVLAQLFSQADAYEAQIISYLTLGLLRPPYQTTQFGLAKKSMASVLAGFFETSTAAVTQQAHELGDLGSVAAQHAWQSAKNLTVTDVYDRLCALEELGGTGSQEEKAQALLELLRDVDPISAQMIIRVILGQLRLGFSDMTIIDALSWMLVGNKKLHGAIEHAYNVCADLGRIAFILKQEGAEGLAHVGIVVGIPIRPAAAERLPEANDIFQKLGPCVAQPKLDGFRLQIHVLRQNNTKKIWFFSRNLLDMSKLFPDLVRAFEHYDTPSLIVEGEAIVYNPQTDEFLPFQETVKRKRKHDIEEAIVTLPLRLFLFDILFYGTPSDGSDDVSSQLDKPHCERRKLLEKLFGSSHEKTVSVIDERPIHTDSELEAYFDEVRQQGLEGLVVKRPDAIYQPGKRNFNWIKLKQSEGGIEDTVDVVILGYYFGSGKRSTFGIGAFLAGVYNPTHDRFETIAKVGTGLTDSGWRELKKCCDEKVALAQPHNVICAKELFPDVWVHPEITCTLRADEITFSPLHTAGKKAAVQKTQTEEACDAALGLALRFPRFVGYRFDKSAEEATTVDEIKSMMHDQRALLKKKP